MACPQCAFEGVDDPRSCPRCRAAAAIRPATEEDAAHLDALLRADAVFALAAVVPDDLPATERRVARVVDGIRTVERIRKRCGLTPVELQAALTALHERGLLRLVGFADAAAAHLDDTTGETTPRPQPLIFSHRIVGDFQAMIDEESRDAADAADAPRGERDLRESAADARRDPLSPEFQHLGVPISVLATAVTGLDADAIAAHFGRAFFVVCARDTPAGPAPGDGTDDYGPTGSLNVTVFFARRRTASDQLVVTIGRGGGNDISLADDSVSRFHAYLKEVDGTFLLQDAKSLHGTTVDERPVLPRGSGPPTELRNGQSVRFGAVSAIFVDAAGLIPLLSRRER